MKLTLSLVFLFMSMTAFAQFDAKKVASEMTVMSRAMDRLFARQEMKDAMPTILLHKAFQQTALRVGSEEARKVALLTNDESLKNCQDSYQQAPSTVEGQIDAVVEYKGDGCPLQLSAKVHSEPNSSGMTADTVLHVKIISQALLSEIDMSEFSMPMKIAVSASPTDQGFVMNMQVQMSAQILSQKYGKVDYTAQLVTDLTFGQSMKSKATTVETFASGSQKVTFTQIQESVDNNQTESYAVDGVPVSKAQFDERHSSVVLPGMNDQPTPLEDPHTCKIKAYDSSVYSLEKVRRSILDNTVDSLKPSETFQPLFLAQTGKQVQPFLLGGKNLQLEVAITPDAARFAVSKQAQDGSSEELGRITAVLGDKVDLTKVITNRVIRVTCAPQ